MVRDNTIPHLLKSSKKAHYACGHPHRFRALCAWRAKDLGHAAALGCCPTCVEGALIREAARWGHEHGLVPLGFPIDEPHPAELARRDVLQRCVDELARWSELLDRYRAAGRPNTLGEQRYPCAITHLGEIRKESNGRQWLRWATQETSDILNVEEPIVEERIVETPAPAVTDPETPLRQRLAALVEGRGIRLDQRLSPTLRTELMEELGATPAMLGDALTRVRRQQGCLQNVEDGRKTPQGPVQAAPTPAPVNPAAAEAWELLLPLVEYILLRGLDELEPGLAQAVKPLVRLRLGLPERSDG